MEWKSDLQSSILSAQSGRAVFFVFWELRRQCHRPNNETSRYENDIPTCLTIKTVSARVRLQAGGSPPTSKGSLAQ